MVVVEERYKVVNPKVLRAGALAMESCRVRVAFVLYD